MELRGKAAVITGSSVGVGRATAIAFAEQGCSVAVNYNRSRAEAEEAAELCRAQGVKAIAVQADVSSDDDCRRLIQTAADQLGHLEILVNNAAVTEFIEFSDLEKLTEEIWLKILRTNLLGNFFCSRAAIPHMEKAGEGAIVNVGSIAGFLGHGSSIAYSASKAPGAMDTRWLRQGIGEKGFERLRESLRHTTILQEMLTPEDVADAIVFLVRDARLMTGETIKLDGGQHLGTPGGLHRR
jgi:3-oxoacyl-[acyl-carrier protein] reductase